tara:strand:+ start:742 stop:2322 length:1581 start_codon:yes stop_codon:yes gene_type:complete
MGINLRDIASFAEGAIERDRELTKEDFEIRNANLAANRDMLIKQKEKKYEKELDNYYAEKEKFDTLSSAAVDFADKKITPEAYATLYYTTKMGKNFALLDDKTKRSLINNFDGKTVDYTLKGNIDEINKNAAIEQTTINDATVAAIKEAKGDSFLINKILNKKGVNDKKLLDSVQSKIDAAETIELTQQNIDPNVVGLEVKTTGGDSVSALMSKFANEANSDKYQTEWSKQRDKINYNPLKDESGIRFLNTSANLGGSDELTFKYNATDQKISGLNSSAFTFADSMKYFFNGVKANDDEMVKHYYNVTPLHGNISKTWNEENIYSQVESIIEPRSGNIKEDPFGGGGKIRLTTIVPLSIVGLDTNANVASLKAINSIMNDYIIKETKARYTTEKKNKTYQQIANNVYSEIYRGTNKDAIDTILNNFNELVTSQNKNNNIGVDTNKVDNSTNTTTQDNKPVDTKTITSNNIVADVGIKSEDGKSILTWEKIEETNQVDGLNTEEKAAYDIWKSKQPTDIKLSGNESS